MLSADKADELGCKQNDLRCLCANKNFLYGLRDCSAAICPAEDARKVVEYGISICAGKPPFSAMSMSSLPYASVGAGVSIQTSGGGSGGASNTGSAAGSATTNGASSIATTSASSPATVSYPTPAITVPFAYHLCSQGTAGSSTDGEQASGKVSTIFSTLTTDGKTITTGIATTIAGNVSDGGSSSSDTDAAGHVSTFTTIVTESDGSIHTTVGQTTLTGASAFITSSVTTAAGTGPHHTGSAVLTTVTSDGSAIIKTLTTVHKTSEPETTLVTESLTKPEPSSGSDTEATATDSGSSSASSTSSSTAAGVSLRPLLLFCDSF